MLAHDGFTRVTTASKWLRSVCSRPSGCLHFLIRTKVQRSASVTGLWSTAPHKHPRADKSYVDEMEVRRCNTTDGTAGKKTQIHNVLKEEEEKSAFAPRRKPAYSLHAQFNPAYLCKLCISSTFPCTHTPNHSLIYMKQHNRFWFMFQAFLSPTALQQEE